MERLWWSGSLRGKSLLPRSKPLIKRTDLYHRCKWDINNSCDCECQFLGVRSSERASEQASRRARHLASRRYNSFVRIAIWPIITHVGPRLATIDPLSFSPPRTLSFVSSTYGPRSRSRRFASMRVQDHRSQYAARDHLAKIDRVLSLHVCAFLSKIRASRFCFHTDPPRSPWAPFRNARFLTRACVCVCALYLFLSRCTYARQTCSPCTNQVPASWYQLP